MIVECQLQSLEDFDFAPGTIVMNKSIRTFGVCFAIAFALQLCYLDQAHSQSFNEPMAFAASTINSPAACRHCYQPTYVAAMMVTPAFYAPQVPVVPMAYGPVPTVSAYYVPTVPVVYPVVAEVVPVRKHRHHHWHKHRKATVVPVAIYPVWPY